jgi:tetratricopeptide (TPR) repeat protein
MFPGSSIWLLVVAGALPVVFSLTLAAQAPPGQAQGAGAGRGPRSELIRQAVQLDNEGRYGEARRVLQKAIDTADSPAAKAAAQRAMAMSWAFAGDCGKVREYEQMVIDYWVTREKEEPANAFYQQGEMANEAARVCIDVGDLDAAQTWYRKGHELGMKEPGISEDRKALWDFRLQHALARIAARRGNRSEAEKHVKAARAALDRMTELRKQQEIFFPYLTGYVAFYLGDHKTALEHLQQANQRDVFIQTLIAEVHEKRGDKEKAQEYYTKAAASSGHNPPAAYAHHVAEKAVR